MGRGAYVFLRRRQAVLLGHPRLESAKRGGRRQSRGRVEGREVSVRYSPSDAETSVVLLEDQPVGTLLHLQSD